LRHVMNASSARMKDENSQQIGSLFFTDFGTQRYPGWCILSTVKQLKV
jgi:hypothetical protein